MKNQPHGGWAPHPPPGGFGPSQQALQPAGLPGTSSERGSWRSTSPGLSVPSPPPQMRPNGPYFHHTGAPPAPFMPPWRMQSSPPVGPGYIAPPMQRPSYNPSGYVSHPHSTRSFAGMNLNPRLAVMPVPQGSNFPQIPPQGFLQQTMQMSQQGQQTPAQEYLGLPTGDQKKMALVPSNREHFDASHSFSWLFQGAENDSVTQPPVESLGDATTGGLNSEAVPQRVTVSKVAELRQLIGQVEETIVKVLSVVNLKSLVPGAELASCPIDPQHRVPAKALFRHFIQCNPGFQGGAFEVDSFLGRLQYPRTAPVLHSDPLMLPEEDSTAPHAGSRDSATLSFEDSALLTVNPNNRDVSILKQELMEAQPSTNSAVDFPDSLKVRPAERGWMSKSGMTSFVTSLGKREFHLADSFFFYRGAPGVVLKPSSLQNREPNDFTLSLPLCLQAELASDSVVEGTKNSSTEKFTNEKLVPCNHLDKSVGNENLLLSSMVWFIEREVEAWEHLPTWCSGIVLEAGVALGNIKKSLILEWLLVHSPPYGVALDVAMACHIYCLVQLFLKAVKTQCTDIVRKYMRSRAIKKEGVMLEDSNLELVMPKTHKPRWNAACPVFTEAGAWLALSLSPLYGHAQSQAIVLHVLKYCLKVSARLLSCVPLEPHLEQFTKVCTMVKGKSVGSEINSSGVRCDALAEQGRTLSEEADHGEMICVKQVEAAIDALYERAAIASHINFKNSVNVLTKSQLIADYDKAVGLAVNERFMRPSYRAVSEHDGLTWQGSQQQERRNKTKAELLAEERDYKRRRMSYKGKKLKRTPREVLRDIITGHMTEITEAGGIGCFAKQLALSSGVGEFDEHTRTDPSPPAFQHHFGTTTYPEKLSVDKASYSVLPSKRAESYSSPRIANQEGRSDRGRSDSKYSHDIRK